MSGYDWLNVSLNGTSGTVAPPVSFGATSEPRQLNPPTYNFKNASADTLEHRTLLSDLKTGSVDNLKSYVDPESIPLSLTAQELTLQESKTYMRWYSDILARTNSRTITMHDVFTFLNNFRISAEVKDKIKHIFSKIMNSINIGEFFALLRVISHCLSGAEPSRHMIKMQAPVPAPPSILSKKRHSEEEEKDKEEKPLDIDSFTQFMLTGERPDAPKKKRTKLKSVKFSDQIVTDVHEVSPLSEADYASLSMNELLQLRNQESEKEANYGQEQSNYDHEYEQTNQSLQNYGQTNPANQNSQNHGQTYSNIGPPDLLKPNMTGPAQMRMIDSVAHNRYASLSPPVPPRNSSPYPENPGTSPYPDLPGTSSPYPELPGNNLVPLRPNVTGPADMARIFAPQQDAPKISLQAYTSQMTGNTQENTMHNRIVSDSSRDKSLPPPPVPTTRRSRSVSSPTPHVNGKVPPPPPPRRRNGPPLPPKEELSSTGNILDDLKALQDEVDRIRSMTGGF